MQFGIDKIVVLVLIVAALAGIWVLNRSGKSKRKGTGTSA